MAIESTSPHVTAVSLHVAAGVAPAGQGVAGVETMRAHADDIGAALAAAPGHRPLCGRLRELIDEHVMQPGETGLDRLMNAISMLGL